MKNLILILLILGITQTSFSQDIRSSTSGFSVNANGLLSGWSSDSFFLSDLAEEESSGVGFNVGVGYGFDQRFSAHVHYSFASFASDDIWDNFSASSFDVIGRITFGATLRPIRPYLGVGFTSVSMKIDPVFIENFGQFELSSNGIGFLANGGADYFITPNISVGVQAEFSSGTFSDISLSGESIEVDESVDFSFFKVNLG